VLRNDPVHARGGEPASALRNQRGRRSSIGVRKPTMPPRPAYQTAPSDVHKVLGQWILADGLPIVYDVVRSHDAFIVDSVSGKEYLDLFSFFASMPIGHNHPKLADPGFREKLLLATLTKPSNSDIYTQAMADFVRTLSRTLPPAFNHMFFIEGGALAVENALKVAFDWKVRKNIGRGFGDGIDEEDLLGTKVIHFRTAFHGRSGYTLSLTNGFSPDKVKYFPKFKWPRISTPGLRFPLDEENLRFVISREQQALREIHDAIEEFPHDIAAIVIETIQGEGGDVHFRREFLQALRDIADKHDIILIFDEIQTGMGITGGWWAFEQHGVQPDIFAFGKKTQVCGIAATDRVNEIDSCFKISSRINSTWGGSLADMVRCTRYIEIIEEENLLANAREVGGYLQERLVELSRRFPKLVSNARGAGLMCAFDLPDATVRDRVVTLVMEENALILPCGPRSIRFRPVLDFTRAHVDEGIDRIARSLAKV
jgi:L-lysine 6-transaminase